MDPDANLAEQKEIRERITLCQHGTGCNCVHDADRLAELGDALDDWIAGGGYLPNRWLRQRG